MARAWRWAGWVAIALALAVLVGGALVFGPWVVAPSVLNFAGLFSLSVSLLAVWITVLIYQNQTRQSATDKAASEAILEKIGDSSSTAAERAGSADGNTIEIIRLLGETMQSKASRALSEVEAAEAAVAYSAAPKGGKQILWVDDNVDWISLERDTLKAAGVSSVWVSNTERALSLLAGNSFSAVVTDMGRVEGDREGYVLLDAMRERGDNTPVIVYSTSRHPSHVAEVIDHGGQGATNNPFELFEIVMGALG
ncbi:response regulator [Microbacterium sp. NPDC089190]|uniref:response regulator n=1 Tax=Microbacterium sp. NPDC089190 TaxID=3155063 RepID=UPI00344DA195